MKTGAVIAAAGMSTRMHDFKPLIKLGNMTIASRVVSNFRMAGVNDIVMVTGYRAEDLEKELKGCGVTFLRNEKYASTEMFDSVKIGLEYLRGRVDRILFCPGDVPFFHDSTLRAELAKRAPLIIPRHDGRRGHPIMFDASLIPEILAHDGERGLKGALDSANVEPLYIDVDDVGTIIDVDTPEDLQKLRELWTSSRVHPAIKLQLAGEEAFFGPGPVTLFMQIDRLGSVREACQKTGISYSKGWKMISTAESALNMQLVERQQGGKHGGAASLTDECRDIIRRYEKLNQEVAEYARKEYEKIFGDCPFF